MDTTTIDPVAALISDPTRGSGALGAKELGRDEFLKLLVAKLENQDPLSPTQDTEFVEQLATFSSLEQLIGVNGNLESLALGQANIINAQALDLIGKEALVESDYELRVKDGQPDTMVYTLPAEAREATLTIVGEDGSSVRSFELETTPRGRITLEWDGLDDDGDPVEDGNYTIEVYATDLEGEPLSIALFRSMPIESVSFADGLISLISGDRLIPFEMILEIRAGRA